MQGGGCVAVLRGAAPPAHPHGYAEQMYYLYINNSQINN